MPTIEVKRNHELTVDQAIQIFTRHFNGNCLVYRTKYPRKHFAVKKNWKTAVGIKINQENGNTTFNFAGMPGSVIGWITFVTCTMCSGLLGYRWFLKPSLINAEEEVANFIRSSSDFS